jgi:aerobic carbon-monoxide dehydrogenase large subunit
MNAPGASIAAARFVGQRVPRKEDARLLTGRGTYIDDVVVPGMLQVAFARSPIARGRIVSIDTSAARELPGVHAIFISDDLARMPVEMVSFFMIVPPPGTKTHPLAVGRVAHVGDPVALVVADDRYIAEDAAGLIEIDYEAEEPVVTIAQARKAPPIHPDLDDNVAAMAGDDEEDPELEAIFAGAAHVVSGTVSHQRISASPMEGRGVVVSPNGANELTIHIGCQSPHMFSRQLSLVFGMPETNIRVIAKDVGGSFGLKTQAWREEIAVIAAARLLGRPLKWIEDRLENLTAAVQARDQECTLRLAFDADARLLAAHIDYAVNNGAYPHMPDQNMPVAMFMWTAYKCPRVGFLLQGFHTNTAGLGAYRGPWAMETLVRETMLDVAARQIGIDPIEIRRRNLITATDQPLTTSFGIPITDITSAECLEALLAKVDVAAFRKEQAAAREQGRYLGIGIAAYVEPTGGSSFGPLRSDVAQVRIEPTGKVTAVLSTHSQGHGTQTTMAQVIADQLGVPIADVSVFEDDSSRGGFGPGAAGSRQAIAGGGASIRASALLVDKVKRIAAHLLNANIDDLRIEDGMVHVSGVAEMSRSLREIAEIAYGEPARLPPGMESGLEAQYRYQPPDMTMTSAAHACIVEVDAETGFVAIKRWVGAEDCGIIINPAVVEGQVAGGLAQGIGMTLLEEFGYDAQGNPTTATFKDYLLPAISDVPDFEYIHLCTPSQSEGGFRGIGEGGAIIGPPTLINAIADALSPFNARCLDLPLTPSRILELIEGRSGKSRHGAPAHGDADAGTTATVPATDEPVAAPMTPTVEEPQSVEGAWKIVMSTAMGPQTMVARFTTDGATLTGVLENEMGAEAFAGTVENNRLVWSMKVTKPMSITLKYDVLIEGDRLTGKCKMGMFGTAKLAGERVESS